MGTTLFQFIFVAVFFQSSITNKSILMLPLTFNPLLQEGIEIEFAKLFYTNDENFYSKVTISDVLKALGFSSSSQIKKELNGVFITVLSAKDHGLTYELLEYKETSKWSIAIPLQELANASETITSIPLTGKITVIAIQKAMFRILEQKYQFNTTEVMDSLSFSQEEIYSALEAQWIDIVHYITKKSNEFLSTTYSISPCYIATSLNVTVERLYNSTLTELDNILINKTEIIKGLVTSTASTCKPATMTTHTTAMNSFVINTKLITNKNLLFPSIVSSYSIGDRVSPEPVTPSASKSNPATTDITSNISLSTIDIRPTATNSWIPSFVPSYSNNETESGTYAIIYVSTILSFIILVLLVIIVYLVVKVRLKRNKKKKNNTRVEVNAGGNENPVYDSPSPQYAELENRGKENENHVYQNLADDYVANNNPTKTGTSIEMQPVYQSLSNNCRQDEHVYQTYGQN